VQKLKISSKSKLYKHLKTKFASVHTMVERQICIQIVTMDLKI